MSAISVIPRIRCKRPVAAKKPLRRISDDVFRTIVQMAYEMASCQWRDTVIEQLTPLFRSVKAYADKPRRLNGRFPPLRREEGWVRPIIIPVYPEKLDNHIVAKHEYLSLTSEGERIYLEVTIHRTWKGIDERKDTIEYFVYLHVYTREYSLAVDGSYQHTIYLDIFPFDEAEQRVRLLKNITGLTLILDNSREWFNRRAV